MTERTKTVVPPLWFYLMTAVCTGTLLYIAGNLTRIAQLLATIAEQTK